MSDPTGTMYVVIWAKDREDRIYTHKTIVGYVTSIEAFHEYVAQHPQYQMAGNVTTNKLVEGINTTYLYITEADKLV